MNFGQKAFLQIDKSGMLGPLRSELGDRDVVSRLFPLKRSGKVRPIDDLSRSHTSATVTCYKQATVDGPDVICAFAAYLMRCFANQGRSTELLGSALLLGSRTAMDACIRCAKKKYNGQRLSARSSLGLATLMMLCPSLPLRWLEVHKRHCV